MLLELLLALVLAQTPTSHMEPWSVDQRHPVLKDPSAISQTPPNSVGITPTPPPEAGSSFLGVAFLFYSRLVTHIDGPRCAHRPSCALYAFEAIQLRGFPQGLWLAFSRLMRGAYSSALRRLPLVQSGHELFFFDPIESQVPSGSGWKK